MFGLPESYKFTLLQPLAHLNTQKRWQALQLGLGYRSIHRINKSVTWQQQFQNDKLVTVEVVRYSICSIIF